MTVTAKLDGSPAADLVKATIDGIEVEVPKGTLIIRAAEQIGIHIPRFCDHPLLDKVAACRQCLVEVAMPGPDGTVRTMTMPGSPNVKPQPACAMELTPGMQVKTQHTSPAAEQSQHGVMELLLINHPLDCPVCDKGGECPLQNQAMSDGRGTSRFIDVKRTFPKPIRISTQVLLDRERCIVCQRCTRFTKQIAGDAFIDLQKRGASQQIGTFSPGVLGIATSGEQMLDETGVPFASYFSGNTIQICPVGALTSAAYRFRSRPFDLVSTPGICDQCACGCAQRSDYRRGVVVRRLAGNDPEVNEEWTCDKGRFAFHWSTLDDRLTSPMVRNDDGELEPVSWPMALQAAAEGLRRASAGGFGDPDDEADPLHAARGVGVLTGGMLTVEDAYAYAKFARLVLGTNDIDFRARPHSAEEAAFLAAHVAGAEGVSYADVEAAGTVLLVCLEPEEEAPILFLRLRKAATKRGTKVVSLAPFATRGLQKLDGRLVECLPGAEAAALADLAETLGGAASVILVGERAATSPATLGAVAALAAQTGAKLAWVPRRVGERGAVEAGALPGLLPAGRSVEVSEARVDVGAAWGGELPSTPGRDTAAMIAAAAAGELGALLAAGLDLDDLPDPQAAREAFQRAPFVVSLEVRSSSVTEFADVVLPVAPVAEKSGSYLNWEGRVRPFVAVLDSRAMSDTRVLGALAGQLGTSLGLADSADAATELAELGRWEGARAAMPAAPSTPTVTAVNGGAVLATWHLLLDAGRGQDGEAYLAGTAHRPHARMSPATAESAGIGAAVVVGTERGEITMPVVRAPMPDDVVWLPTNSPGSRVRATLGADAGDPVTIRPASTEIEGSQS
jgi:NADH-quinone oxidoreductase subunit G